MAALFKFPGLFLPEKKRLLALLVKVIAPTSRTVTASTTLVADDVGGIVRTNVAGANTVTVPPNADVPIDVDSVFRVQQAGAGATTITAGAGVTVNKLSTKTLVMAGQHGEVTLRKVATNTWVVTGDLTAV